MTQEKSYIKELEDLSRVFTELSEGFLKHLKALKAGSEKNKGEERKENFKDLTDQMTTLKTSLETINHNFLQLKESISHKPSPSVLSRNVIYLCFGIAITSSLVTVFSLYLIDSKKRYELGPQAIRTCSKGRMLEQAWPKLTKEEKKKINPDQ